MRCVFDMYMFLRQLGFVTLRRTDRKRERSVIGLVSAGVRTVKGIPEVSCDDDVEFFGWVWDGEREGVQS